MYDLPSYGNKEIAVLYRQMDGYPEGHGEELENFLKGLDSISYNGAECLAAQIVAHFKKGFGKFYLYPAGTRNIGEEYIYHVRPLHNCIRVDIEKIG
jgi:hypothetical protein